MVNLNYSEFVKEKFREGDRLNHAILGLVGEVGELVDAYKKGKYYGQKYDFENFKEELGDISFYFQAILNELEVSEEEIKNLNMEKLNKRYKDKFTEQEAQARRDKSI